ncbi:MAG: hypothetical protein BMS9Abin24_132 [Thermodesulfobacteriota bacterium]|nr:MAG: hypothetical protein BMS9Abin24_132 [Thermodesulfobacteriota bacterium]
MRLSDSGTRPSYHAKMIFIMENPSAAGLYCRNAQRGPQTQKGVFHHAMILKIALFLHIISAIFWVGGMLFLVLVIAPYLKTLTDPRDKSKIFQVVGKQFRRWGWVAIITLLVTGPIILYKLYGIPVHRAFSAEVHSTGFGRALGFKLSLVIIIVLSALFHDFWIGPKARSSPTFSKLARIFGRTNLLIALLIVIFAVIMRAGGF